MEFLETPLLNNTLAAWLTALLIAALTLVGLWLIQRIIVRRFSRLAHRTATTVDDLISGAAAKTRFSILALLSLYVGSQALTLPTAVTLWIDTLAIFIFLLQVAIWGDTAVSLWLQNYRADHLDERADQVTKVRALSFVVRLALFSVLLLLALDNIPGVEVTTLVASLGIGGVAVALAVQNILGDLFASLSIALDEPFVIGDFIKVGDLLGKVENIGLKTTRVRSLWGEQLVFSNSDLLNSRILNYQDMQERRVSFTLGVTYATPPEKLRRIPNMVETIVTDLEQTRFDRAHFNTFGDFALMFEIVYYVLSPDYNVYMDIQQNINLAILERFNAAGIEIAFPTQTLFVRQVAQPERPQPEREPAGENGRSAAA